jgi:hypothetical protein
MSTFLGLMQAQLQFLREQVNDVLLACWRVVVAQIHEQARLERRFEKPGVRFRESLGITILLKSL